MNIDHHLQQAILEKLAQSGQLVRYSDLKDDTIENSLFSYHLNKLIDRKMVDKTDDGYRLSIDGARWLNDNGFALRQSETLRVYVALVIQNDAGEYLVGQRTGQFKSTINDYILPSNAYVNELDLSDQIDTAIATFIPNDNLGDITDYGFVQIKAAYVDDVVLRSLFHVSYCYVTNFEPTNTKQASEYTWMSKDEIDKIKHPSAGILREIIDYTQDADNHHETPLFFGD
ncbi:MAG: hypothetical protein JWO07_38 [Candidatus Saccharibacteria bacterium]|nr:hypothetical protein [Candidatus Saccharibacteria bacterium]